MFDGLKREVGRGYRAVFMLALCMGLLAFAALFMERQAGLVYDLLSNDFRIILITDDKYPLDELKLLEDRLRAIEHVASVSFVSREDALKFLRAKDPELALSATALGSNPLPEFFELRVDEAALGNLGPWLDSNVLKKFPGVTGVSYKPEAAYAILQAGFYRKFIRLVLSLSAVLLALLAASVEFEALRRDSWPPSRSEALGRLFSGILGAAAALLLCWLMIAPMRYLSPLFWAANPPWLYGSVLAAGELLGWTSIRWKNPS